MPFRSKAQQRAAFAGAIPGFSKARAKEWASETDFSKLPERAKKSAAHDVARRAAVKAIRDTDIADDLVGAIQPGMLRDLHGAYTAHRDRNKDAALEGLVKLCGLIVARSPGFRAPSVVTANSSRTLQNATKARRVGAFAGAAPKTLPGPAATSQAVNPGKTLRTAITPTTTKAVGSPRATLGF